MQVLRLVNRVRITVSARMWRLLPAHLLAQLESLAAEKLRRRGRARLFVAHRDWPQVRAIIYGLGLGDLIPNRLR